MSGSDFIPAMASAFIAGMIWLRTRMQYAQRHAGPPRLARVGWLYFAAVLGFLALGWFAAAPLSRALWPSAHVAAPVARVVWSLATYYLFILVHRVFRANGAEVYTRAAED